jgi:hypothetical protein
LGKTLLYFSYSITWESASKNECKNDGETSFIKLSSDDMMDNDFYTYYRRKIFKAR